LPTGSYIVGRDTLEQANNRRNHYFPGGQSGSPLDYLI
jgi:hypothetical protein